MDCAGESPGDGPKTRTDWAGVGDRMLLHDAGGDGQITQDREFAATDWDPTARDDRTALRVWSEVSELERLRGVRDIKGLRNGIQLALRNGRGKRGDGCTRRDIALCGSVMTRVFVHRRALRGSILQMRFGSGCNA